MMKQLSFYFLTSIFIIKIVAGQSVPEKNKTTEISIDFSQYNYMGEVDERFQSYNIEMASVLGGNFWKPYTDMDTLPIHKKGPLKGTDAFQALPPIDLYNAKLRTLAKGLAPAYVRVSGSWASSAYFQDNNEAKMNAAPKGFTNVLTRAEWKGVIDFIKATGSKLIISFAGSSGVRDSNGVWTPKEAQKLIDYTRTIGGKIYAAQLFNEPNILAGGYPMPEKYTANDFARDVNAFNRWAKRAVPAMKTHGPGNTAEGLPGISLETAVGKSALSSDEMMSAVPGPRFDIFSFHFYGAVSMRSGDRAPWAITLDSSLTGRWLERIDSVVAYNIRLRDKYLPGAPVWNTETAQASWGGDPWAAGFIDVFRYLHQLGTEAKMGVKVNIHNTLESSEYSLINRKDFAPKPNYWAALLWARFMGTKVYDAGSANEGVYLFVHSLKGVKNARTVLVINTGKPSIKLSIPRDAQKYTLTADSLTSEMVRLNGAQLKMTNNEKLPLIAGQLVTQGVVELPGLSTTFLTFK